MSRRDNDSLEEFFRKATRHPDVQFNEGDWANLEKRLDAELGAPPRTGTPIRNRILFAVAFLALVSVLTLTLWRGQHRDAANLAVESQTVPSIAPAPTDKTQGETSATNHDDEFTADTQSPALSNPQATDENRNAADSPSQAVEGTRAGKSPATQAGGTTHSNTIPNSSQSHAVQRDISVGEAQDELWMTTSEISTSGFSPSQPDPKELLNGKGESVPARTVLAGSDQPVDSASAVETAGAPDATVTTEVASEEKNAAAFRTGRFGISVVVAPDFSMTTGGGAMGPGEAAGLMLHYRAFDRWGITVGALHNTKKYWGRGNEYRPPRGYWKALTNGIVPDRIDGTCAMYEIPVSVTFDVVQTKRSRLFVGAGLSSYFMRNEEYYYKFDDPNPGAVTGWSGDKPRTLWFGIGTISAGYDFRATRSLSFGVEPYFKVPLEGIGWADVDLYSTGLMFAARYHFMKSGNKHPPPSHGP